MDTNPLVITLYVSNFGELFLHVQHFGSQYLTIRQNADCTTTPCKSQWSDFLRIRSVLAYYFMHYILTHPVWAFLFPSHFYDCTFRVVSGEQKKGIPSPACPSPISMSHWQAHKFIPVLSRSVGPWAVSQFSQEEMCFTPLKEATWKDGQLFNRVLRQASGIAPENSPESQRGLGWEEK